MSTIEDVKECVLDISKSTDDIKVMMAEQRKDTEHQQKEIDNIKQEVKNHKKEHKEISTAITLLSEKCVKNETNIKNLQNIKKIGLIASSIIAFLTAVVLAVLR